MLINGQLILMFFDEQVSLSRSSIAREAKLNERYFINLQYNIRREIPFKTAKIIYPVLVKYGYKEWYNKKASELAKYGGYNVDLMKSLY